MAILCRSLGVVTLACVILASPPAAQQPCPPRGPTWATRGMDIAGSVAFDPGRGVVVGSRRDGGYTVEWDGEAWVTRASGGMVGLAYDPVRRHVIGLQSGTQGTQTWEWDGTTWQFRANGGPNPASPLVTDTVRSRIVSPFTGAQFVWEWDGTAWQSMGYVFTPPESGAVAYDPIRARTVVFGAPSYMSTSATMEWDGAARVWTRPVGGDPNRWDHRMVFDPARGRVVMFGGRGSSGVLTDGLEWTGSFWSQSFPFTVPPPSAQASQFVFDSVRQRMIAAGDGGTWERRGSTWEQNTATVQPPPSATLPQVMAFDSSRGLAVAYVTATSAAQTWEWDGTNWRQRQPTLAPTARTRMALCETATPGRTLLFGGVDPSSQFYLSDSWLWDGTNWAQVLPAAAPSGRSEHAMAFDAGHGRSILFGGRDSVSRLGDTWEWDGTTWLLRASIGPSPRRNAALAHDSRRGRTVLFGGDPGSALAVDTWEWDGSTWTQRTPRHSPPARQLHAMAYDASRALVLLYGGLDINGAALGDLWEWDGQDWNQQVLPVAPLPRAGAAMCYDSVRARPTIFGGFTRASNAYSDTWSFSVTPTPCCATGGPGHTSGGLSMPCGSASPRVGGSFCMSFPSTLSVGLVIGDAGTCPTQPVTVDPPAVCQQGFIYPSPVVILFFAGNPAQPCLSIPQDPVLAGQAFCFQGLALQPGFCFLATNALSVRIGAP